MFQDGETSTTSPLLPTPSGMDGGQTSRGGDRKDEKLLGGIFLPTPTAGDGASSENRNLPGSGAHPGTSLTDAIREDRLLPTPNAGATNYDEDPVTWRSRQQILKAKGINGNGAGEPLGVVVRELTSSSEAPRASQPAKQEAGAAPRTTAGSGLPSPVSLASYDPALSWWRTSQVSLLSTMDERFPRSWERWPTSGMTRRGQAFALPMSERPTAASDSSSLPTPMANPANPGAGRDLASREGGQSLPQALLPTPQAWDHDRGPDEARKDRPDSGGDDLTTAIARFRGVPTPSPSSDGSE
jgi:hypothetical protein